MINYSEKGIGLHAAIAAAGHWLEQSDGIWISSNDAAVQAIIDAYTLDQAKADKCAAVLAHAAALRNKVIANISAGEMASWPIKRAEADQYATTGSCPMLEIEAWYRQIPLDLLVQKVKANSARFSGAEAAIGGTDGRHRDAIMRLMTFGEVAAYDYLAGWPEV